MGFADEVVDDNMPFSSKSFCQFARGWGFKVSTSSPRYPQSNFMSERTIQTINNLLRKVCEDGSDPYLALLEYRNTAVSGLLRLLVEYATRQVSCQSFTVKTTLLSWLTVLVSIGNTPFH